MPFTLKPVTIEVVIKHDHEQSRIIHGGLYKRLRMVTSREITLIHLALIITYKNGLKEDEWPNFEFYPCLQNNKIREDRVKKLFINQQLRPLFFRMTVLEILSLINPGTEDKIMKLELNYKKKPMP